MVSHCIDRLKNGHKTPVAHSLYSNLYVRFQSISRSSIHGFTYGEVWLCIWSIRNCSLQLASEITSMYHIWYVPVISDGSCRQVISDSP